MNDKPSEDATLPTFTDPRLESFANKVWPDDYLPRGGASNITRPLSNPTTFEEAVKRYGLRGVPKVAADNPPSHPFDSPSDESASEQTLEMPAIVDDDPEPPSAA